MTTPRPWALNLASAFLAGAWSAAALAQRGAQALGRKQRGLTALVRRVLAAYPDAPHSDDHERLAAFVAARGRLAAPQTARVFPLTPRMRPNPAWPVPAITTTAALAQRLGLTPSQLDWFADRRGMEAKRLDGPLRHYTYRWLTSRGGKRRLLEAPRPRLKALQRRILHELLDAIPAHDAAHGYRPGRSILTFAAPHASRRVVLRMDLRDFFPSVGAARVRAVFRTAGYPRDVALALAGLCTNVTPADVWPAGGDHAERLRFRSPHLPQGAPTSPALANLCAHRLDRRLTGLARKAGASYTRYADDLAFSGDGDFERGLRRFEMAVARVATEEGFEVNFRKTRAMPRSARQCLAGVVVNERPNGRRRDYELLEAILFNCVRHGPAAQNRSGVADFRAHLAGRVAHLARLNPARGARLRELLGRIVWDGAQVA
jgi:hypothetical protein